jgi:hypothetical protein
LNKAYQLSYNHALQVIRQNGGKVKSKNVVIAYQQPKAVRYEKGFEGHYPNAIISIDKSIKEMKEFTFEGVGIVFNATLHGANNEYEALVEMSINGNPDKIAYLPASTFKGKNDLIWKYGLPKGKHKVTFKWLNPKENVSINVNQAVVYNDTPLSVINQ